MAAESREQNCQGWKMWQGCWAIVQEKAISGGCEKAYAVPTLPTKRTLGTRMYRRQERLRSQLVGLELCPSLLFYMYHKVLMSLHLFFVFVITCVMAVKKFNIASEAGTQAGESDTFILAGESHEITLV